MTVWWDLNLHYFHEIYHVALVTNSAMNACQRTERWHCNCYSFYSKRHYHACALVARYTPLSVMVSGHTHKARHLRKLNFSFTVRILAYISVRKFTTKSLEHKVSLKSICIALLYEYMSLGDESVLI